MIFLLIFGLNFFIKVELAEYEALYIAILATWFIFDSSSTVKLFFPLNERTCMFQCVVPVAFRWWRLAFLQEIYELGKRVCIIFLAWSLIFIFVYVGENACSLETKIKTVSWNKFHELAFQD